MNFQPVRRQAFLPTVSPLDRGDGMAILVVAEAGVFEL